MPISWCNFLHNTSPVKSRIPTRYTKVGFFFFHSSAWNLHIHTFLAFGWHCMWVTFAFNFKNILCFTILDLKYGHYLASIPQYMRLSSVLDDCPQPWTEKNLWATIKTSLYPPQRSYLCRSECLANVKLISAGNYLLVQQIRPTAATNLQDLISCTIFFFFFFQVMNWTIFTPRLIKYSIIPKSNFQTHYAE